MQPLLTFPSFPLMPSHFTTIHCYVILLQVPEPLLESKEPLLDQEGADQQKVKEEKSSEAGISNNNCEGGMMSAKHPLLHAWTLWHYKNDPRLQWDANLVRVHTFRSVGFRFGILCM